MKRNAKLPPFAKRAEAAERYEPAPDRGLTDAQAAKRRDERLSNENASVQSKSYARILSDNLLTLFNVINLLLAVAVLAVGAYKNALFIGVVLCNAAIGIFQEIRAKRVVDKLSFLSQSQVTVIRDGEELSLPIDEVVLDDVLLFSNGSQVCTDSIVLTGECEVNESFVTGESDAVFKKPGDLLLAGSFVVSGACRARADRVADGNYISRISAGAKYIKKETSQSLAGLKRIIKIMSVIILPLGIALFLKEYSVAHDLTRTILGTAAALINMIPQGLMLLTSSALALGVVKLSRERVLVQDLYAIEMLARTDTLCLDKTGTLTEGRMEVVDLVPLRTGPDLETALRSLCAATGDTNATAEAVRAHFGKGECLIPTASFPFSSKTKWSGANFGEHGCYVMGACEFLFPAPSGALSEAVRRYADDYRIIVLAFSNTLCSAGRLPEGMEPLALVLLRDRIRPNADKVLQFFYAQGVDMKIISGDSPQTVAGIAKTVGVRGWEKHIDCSTLKTDAEVAEAAGKYTVFGRVTPEMKKSLVLALKAGGHTVAMTGDGVNDVLALKEADCGIAMAGGSDAARNVANLVLMDSAFDPLPAVIAEGRRSVNNIQRSASLFLVKTFYSTLLTILLLFLPGMNYPFAPIQTTLIGSLAIGMPSMVLAFTPNRDRIQGSFFRNVIVKAVPGALTIFLSLSALFLFQPLLRLSHAELSTIAVIVTGSAAIMVLYTICRPLNLLRAALLATVAAAFALCNFLADGFFELAPLAPMRLLLLGGLVLFAGLLLWALGRLAGYILRKYEL